MALMPMPSKRQKVLLILDGDIANKLTCNECGRYISRGPVKISRQKGTLCGRCSQGQRGALSNFNLLAQYARFPCINRLEGCRQLLAASEVAQHEEKCTSRSFACELSNCTFKGTSMKLLAHFKDSHSVDLLATSEIVIVIEHNFSHTYMYHRDDRIFYVNATYSESTSRVNFSARSILDADLVPAKIRLKNTYGEEICSIVNKPEKQTFVDISEYDFPNAVVVLSFEIYILEGCLYSSFESPKSEVEREEECEIFNVIELAGYCSFLFRISSFSRLLLEDFVLDSRKMMNNMWSVMVEPVNLDERQFLRVSLSCMPIGPTLAVDFEVDLAIQSNVSRDMEVRATLACSMRDGETVHCVFENFIACLELENPTKGLISNDSLTFKVGLREHTLKPVAQTTNESAVAFCDIIDVSRSNIRASSFSFRISNFSILCRKFTLVSDPCMVYNKKWVVTVEPTYLNGETRKFLTVTVSCMPGEEPSTNELNQIQPNLPNIKHDKNIHSIIFHVDLALKSSKSSEFEICATAVSDTIEQCRFENFAEYSDILDSRKGFKCDDSLTFIVNLRRHVRLPSVQHETSLEAQLQETTFFIHSFNMSRKNEEQRSPTSKAWQMLWTVSVNFGLVHDSETYLSMYLHCSPESEDVNWTCKASATFILLGAKSDISKTATHMFHKGEPKKGFRLFAKQGDILEKGNGFVRNNSIAIRVLLVAEKPKLRPVKVKKCAPLDY